MIVSFGDDATADLYHGRTSARVRRFPQDVVEAAQRKLDMLHAAARLEDLRMPPALRLKALKGRFAGLHSIRVNDQWRILFRWTTIGATQVSLVDYH